MKGGGAIQCSPEVPCFCYSLGGEEMFTTIFITPECEICDKYDSLIPRKTTATIQDDSLVISLTVIST